MSFESFFEAQSFFLWGAFLLALVMGAVVNKTNFCTMGAVSDMVNMGDYSRFRTWLLAIAVAMVGVVVLEYLGAVDADSTFPPYRASQLIWAENILGGFLFGIGMTFASGCGNKTLVRIGGGNIKSIFVLAIIGVIAFYMANPLPGSDQTLFSALFYDWMRPLAIDLDTSSDLGSIISAENPLLTRLIIGGVVALVLLTYIFKSADFRSEKDNVIGGVVVGLAVLGAWYLSSNVVINAEDELYSLSSYYEEWDMLSEDEEGKPSVGRPLSSQSFTFINPMGQTFG
ncbi:MAG: YeeE/YedE family protein, partial [Gammaproteobacteria bacterium]|nr:YeeE/YedE family protein [Gammaproteobacteria bacterium]